MFMPGLLKVCCLLLFACVCVCVSLSLCVSVSFLSFGLVGELARLSVFVFLLLPCCSRTFSFVVAGWLPGCCCCWLQSYGHKAPEIRKAVVTALVQFCLLLGDERARPHLE